jgi:hypothetical protein
MFYLSRKIFLILLLCYLGAQSIMSASFFESSSSGRFVKKTEHSNFRNGAYNFESKSGVEKLFFGDFNAPVEFFVAPSFESAYGFRIVRDSVRAAYFLEEKHIINYDEVAAQLSGKYPSIEFPAALYSTSASEEEKGQAAQQYNAAMRVKQEEAKIKRYEVYAQSFPINNSLADELYAKVAATVDNFSEEREPPATVDGYIVVRLIIDGSCVTFRYVVEDEVRALTVQEPEGELGRLTDICNRIVKDAKANWLNEQEYITLLNE